MRAAESWSHAIRTPASVRLIGSGSGHGPLLNAGRRAFCLMEAYVRLVVEALHGAACVLDYMTLLAG